MKKINTIAAILPFVVLTAFINDSLASGNNHNHGNKNTEVTTTSESGSMAAAGAMAGAISGSLSGSSSTSGSESSLNAPTNASNTTVVTEEAPDIPVSSAAAIVLATCQKGVSAQGQGFGAAMGSPDEVCLLFSLSSLYREAGDVERANATLDRAYTILMTYRSNIVRRFFQAIPLLGNLF